MQSLQQFSCPCCGFRTLKDSGAYEVCFVCFWEDDPVQKEYELFTGGANEVSLREARRNYIATAASDPQFVTRVRPPNPSEMQIVRHTRGLEPEKRAAIERQAKLHLLAILRGILFESIGIKDGASRIATLASQIDLPWRDRLQLFEAIADEMDGFPSGTAREHWAASALVEKDRELAAFEGRIRYRVVESCRDLQERLIADLNANQSV